mmetsp:Transcript_55292/g.128710  ORF Transcript_55292/g.128710 Transcript_55292/m.128710 type:complete len:284 (+) Transcript_55292:570-1421(+)
MSSGSLMSMQAASRFRNLSSWIRPLQPKRSKSLLALSTAVMSTCFPRASWRKRRSSGSVTSISSVLLTRHVQRRKDSKSIPLLVSPSSPNQARSKRCSGTSSFGMMLQYRRTASVNSLALSVPDPSLLRVWNSICLRLTSSIGRWCTFARLTTCSKSCWDTPMAGCTPSANHREVPLKMWKAFLSTFAGGSGWRSPQMQQNLAIERNLLPHLPQMSAPLTGTPSTVSMLDTRSRLAASWLAEASLELLMLGTLETCICSRSPKSKLGSERSNERETLNKKSWK